NRVAYVTVAEMRVGKSMAQRRRMIGRYWLALVCLLTLLMGPAPAPAAQLQRVQPLPSEQAVVPQAAQPPATAPSVPVPVPAATAGTPDYVLGSGDKLRITVFGEKDLSGEFDIDGTGNIAMPLIGNVAAAQQTVAQVAQDIEQKLRNGYLRDPKVSIDV